MEFCDQFILFSKQHLKTTCPLKRGLIVCFNFLRKPTWISWSGWMWSVESSSRLHAHDRAGFRSWATEKDRPRCTSSTLTPLTPNTLPAAKRPYIVSAGTLSCQRTMDYVLDWNIFHIVTTECSTWQLCSSCFLPWGNRRWWISIWCHVQSESTVKTSWPIQSRNSTQSRTGPDRTTHFITHLKPVLENLNGVLREYCISLTSKWIKVY